MFDKEITIAQLMALRMKKELSASDELLLQNWIAADPSNGLLFQELMQEESVREKMIVFEDTDHSIVWNKVLEKLAKLQDEKVPVKKLKLWPRITAAAAAVAAIVFGVWFFSAQYMNYRHPEFISGSPNDANDVKPGKQGATLTLANGKQIKLSDVANGEIAKEAGISVTKTADGQLVYSLSSRANAKDLDPSKHGMTNVLSTAKGETYILTLPDKSKVWLNAASSLTYSASLNEQGKRVVRLSGEGYFEVFKDKARPFVVKTDQQEVEVLGTHFNVNAYNDESAIATTLLEGSVKVTSGKNQQVLKPGFQAVNVGGSIKISEADIDNVVDWKDGDFYFESADFRSVMRKIGRWYDVEIIYDSSVPKNITSNGVISRNNSLSAVLKLIEESGQVRFRIEGKKVLVFK